jgi:hypothetical protein
MMVDSWPTFLGTKKSNFRGFSGDNEEIRVASAGMLRGIRLRH